MHAVQSTDSTNFLRGLSIEQLGHESRAQDLAKRLLNRPAFDYTMGGIILLNIVVMIIEIDRGANEEELSGETHWTETFGSVVLLIFVLELALRLFAYRCSFWKSEWNVFDFIIVFTDGCMFLVALAAEEVFPVAMLRIFRLAKLARVSKVLRVFPELRMLLASLMSSLSTIFWGSCMLFLVLLVWSMVAVLLIHPLNKTIDHEGCDRCSRAYSSVANASLTFWQQIVAGDSWGVGTIPLIEKYPQTALFFVPLFLSVGLAVMNLILGVVVSVAQQAKDELQEEEETQSTIARLEKQSKLLKLCKDMDVDHSGELEKEELYAGFHNPGEFRDSMSALGITKEDFDVVWAMLDMNNSGTVSYKRLVSRLYRLRACKTEFTLAYLKHHVTMMRHMLVEQVEDHHAEELSARKKLQEELHRIEKKGDVLLECNKQLLEKLQIAPWDAHDTEHNNQWTEHKAQRQEQKTQRKEPNDQQITKAAGDESRSLLLHDMSAEPPKVTIGNGNAIPEYEEHVGSCIESNAHGDEQKKRSSNVAPRTSKRVTLHDKVEEIPREKQQPVNKTFEMLQRYLSGPAYLDGSHGETSATKTDETQNWLKTVETSATKIDETQNWLKKVGHDIDMMRLEIKDMFTDIDRKLSLKEASLSAAEQSNTCSSAPFGLLAVPNRNSSCGLPSRCYEKI